jgi:hypothetical protein
MPHANENLFSYAAIPLIEACAVMTDAILIESVQIRFLASKEALLSLTVIRLSRPRKNIGSIASGAMSVPTRSMTRSSIRLRK